MKLKINLPIEQSSCGSDWKNKCKLFMKLAEGYVITTTRWLKKTALRFATSIAVKKDGPVGNNGSNHQNQQKFR